MMDQKEWRVGDTSAIFESAGGKPGTVSLGRGDHGGASYGTYQLASGPGTVQEYLKQSRFGVEFKGLKPASAEFNGKWEQVARDHPDFGTDQHEFIRKTHVDPSTANLAAQGFNTYERGPAVQDMVWSTSVQYRSMTPGVIDRGLREAFGDGYSVTELSDIQVVNAVQDSKLRHVNEDFRSSHARVRSGVETRIPAEKAALSHLAETGTTMTAAELTQHWNASTPIHRGSPTSRVTDLQGRLGDLGILDASGRSIVPDGGFGPSTEQAVKTFQRSVGIPDSGEAGALTMHILAEQAEVHRLLSSTAFAIPSRLDNPAHPDNRFFNQVRDHLVELDKSLGRSPDHYTDNMASALTVQARADGIERIDRINLSSDGNTLHGVKIPEGPIGIFLAYWRTQVPTSEANTPMEQSGARWPEAMQQFQSQEQAEALATQQRQEQSQARRQAQAMDGPSLGR